MVSLKVLQALVKAATEAAQGFTVLETQAQVLPTWVGFGNAAFDLARALGSQPVIQPGELAQALTAAVSAPPDPELVAYVKERIKKPFKEGLPPSADFGNLTDEEAGKVVINTLKLLQDYEEHVGLLRQVLES